MNAQLRDEVALLHSQFCSGLADQSRMLIVYELAEGSCHVNELVQRLGIAQPVISRHLKILRERGIVTSKREGRSIHYSLADQRIVQALDLFRSIIADQLTAQAHIVESLI